MFPTIILEVKWEVLRGRAFNVKYFHFKVLPKIPLEKSPFKTATQNVQAQKGTDR